MLNKYVYLGENCKLPKQMVKGFKNKMLKMVYDIVVKEAPSDVTVYKPDGTIIVQKSGATLRESMAKNKQRNRFKFNK